jgi:hypothetical protein
MVTIYKLVFCQVFTVPLTSLEEKGARPGSSEVIGQPGAGTFLSSLRTDRPWSSPSSLSSEY